MNAKCAVQMLVLIQEELTKEERQDLYATEPLKEVLYISNYLREHVRKRLMLSILTGYNLLHYPPPPFLMCLVRGPLSCCLFVCTTSAS